MPPENCIQSGCAGRPTKRSCACRIEKSSTEGREGVGEAPECVSNILHVYSCVDQVSESRNSTPVHHYGVPWGVVLLMESKYGSGDYCS